MTREEKAAVLEVARQLCLAKAEKFRRLIGSSEDNAALNQALGAEAGARRCAEAIEEAKESTNG